MQERGSEIREIEEMEETERAYLCIEQTASKLGLPPAVHAQISSLSLTRSVKRTIAVESVPVLKTKAASR